VGEGRERSLVPVSDGPLSGGPPSVLDGPVRAAHRDGERCRGERRLTEWIGFGIGLRL